MNVMCQVRPMDIYGVLGGILAYRVPVMSIHLKIYAQRKGYN